MPRVFQSARLLGSGTSVKRDYRSRLHKRVLVKKYCAESDSRNTLTDNELMALRNLLFLASSERIKTDRFTEGFSNDVFKVFYGDRKLVVKRYSAISSLRQDFESCVATHRALDAIGVSPGYVGSTNGLLVSEYIDGSVLTEQDVQQRRIHVYNSPGSLISMHRVEMREDAQPLIWSWIDVMLENLGASEARAPIFETMTSQSVQELLHEISAVRVQFEAMPLRVCFCHGDLKPSNIVACHKQSELKLIDLDLAGPNYRGFDIMKLFRTNDASFMDDSLFSFSSVYTRLLNDGTGAEELYCEAQVCEVLTWLEAAIFFALLIGVGDITNIHRNTLLFKDRWSSYKAVKWKLSYFGRIIDKLSH